MKLDQLTFTRFLAALLIIMYHGGSDHILTHSPVWQHFFKVSNLCVNYFFILSGFVMIVAYAQREKPNVEYRNYYVNRIARIYPVYFIALLLSTIGHLRSIFSLNFSLHTLLLQSWVPGHVLTLNFPGWSLSNETFFYLSFPLLLNYLYKKLDLVTITIAIVIAFIVLKSTAMGLHHSSFYKGFPSNSHDFIFYNPILNISDFILGNLLGLWFLKIPKPYFKNYDLVVIVIAVVAFLMMGLNIALPIIPLVFACLILFMSLNSKGFLSKLFSTKPLVLLGEASYGIYILMVPIFSLVERLSARLGLANASKGTIFYISLITLISLSIISYKLIEIPARNYIKLKLGKAKIATN
jgi:peptidoglycan/LPS O-acetylase OafA/YrhL